MINKVVFEKLKEILKETTDNSVSYGCANPRAITSKDIEIFKMSLDAFHDLKKAYISKVTNREEDRKYLREVSSLLLQFSSNLDKMLKKNALRFKLQKELVLKDPLKIVKSLTKAVPSEEYILKRFEIATNNGKQKGLAFLLGDASFVSNIQDDSAIREGDFKILINRLKAKEKSFVFVSDCQFVNFWPLFTYHFNGKVNVWYEQSDDELGKVIANFTNLAISNGYDVDDIPILAMAENIKVKKPDLGPTELELKYLIESPKEGLMDELVKSFLNHGYKIDNIVNKENDDAYYDTNDRRLLNEGSVLRLRKIKSLGSERNLGTYKSLLPSEGAFHKRIEYNKELGNPSFEDLKNAFSEQVDFSSIVPEPVLNAITKRTDIYLEKDGNKYALSIDNIRYIGKDKTYEEVMVEVELKGKEKDEHSLDTIHDFLARDVEGLILIKESKYQRGMNHTLEKTPSLTLTPKENN